MSVKHIQIIYRSGQQRQQIANVNDNLADYNGGFDTQPPFYIRTWDESLPQTVLDLVDNTLKSAFVTKQECLDKYFCLDVLTIDQFAAPSTWRFVAIDAQIYRTNKIKTRQKMYDYALAKHNWKTPKQPGKPTREEYIESVDSEPVWTLNTVQ